MFVRGLRVNLMRSEADLHDYQRTAIAHLHAHPKSSIFLDVGLGKTAITLTYLKDILSSLDADEQALVIAPIRVAKQTWPTEISEWSQASWIEHTLIRAEDTDPDVQAVYDNHRMRFVQAATTLKLPPGERSRVAAAYAGPIRDRYKREKRARLAMTPTPLHIIGLPQVEWLVQFHGKRWPYKTVIVDESSAFKEFQTKRWKAINSVYKHIDRMHLLTASPAAETWLSLFAQVYLLDRGERFGRRITHFRDRYFSHNPYTYQYTLKPDADKQISEKISDICLVMKAEDHLSLQKPAMLIRPVTLDEHTMDLYDQFVADSILALPDKEIEAVNGGALINKLLQFTGGAVLDEEKTLHEVHTDKIDELRELIDELQGEPLLVGYWYKSSLKRLQKAFPKATTMDRSGACVDDWNAGKIPLLFIHPASAGHGINMQKGPGHDLALFDIPWSRELYDQLIGRIARQGQKKPVRVHHLIVRRPDDGVKRTAREKEERLTADELVMRALADKGAGQDALFRFIKAIRARVRAVVKPSDSEGDDL